MEEFDDELRLARPSPMLQRAMFKPLALIGRLVGYRPWYSRFAESSRALTARDMGMPKGTADH